MTDTKVNFMIVGTQKGGTTALDAYLRMHPDVSLSQVKETHFFDTEEYFKTDSVDYDIYHNFFDTGSKYKMWGEATPIYMYWQDTPRRIWSYNPNTKIIVLLRNPIGRAYSHWNMERSRNAESLSFWDAIRQEQERCRVALPLQHRVYSYIDRSLYAEQLRRLWRYFPKSQVLVLHTKALRLFPRDTLEQVCQFLDIPALRTVVPLQIHEGNYSREMNIQEKLFLQEFFYFDIKTVEKMLGWDCSMWLK